MELAMVTIYHPVTKATVDVPEISLEHHFRAGWIRESDKSTKEPVSEPDVKDVKPEAEVPNSGARVEKEETA